MSLTETGITDSSLNKTIVTERGICEANVLIKSLSIHKQDDGSKSITVQHGEKEIRFFPSQSDCDFLAKLLAE